MPKKPKYFTKKASTKTAKGDRFLGRPYSRGLLRRAMELHPTMKSMMKGMIRWAAKKLRVKVSEATIEKMLGKSGSDKPRNAKRLAEAGLSPAQVKRLAGKPELPPRLRPVKRLADQAFYASMRKMHAFPGTEIVEPEAPVKRKPGTKTKVAKHKKHCSKCGRAGHNKVTCKRKRKKVA